LLHLEGKGKSETLLTQRTTMESKLTTIRT
jgi:hypothetical protein